MVQQWTNIPSVGSTATPQCSGLRGLIDDGFTPQRGKWKVVSIIRPMNNLICRFCWILRDGRSMFNDISTCVQDDPIVAAGIHCW
jgi:hypothetical protein